MPRKSVLQASPVEQPGSSRFSMDDDDYEQKEEDLGSDNLEQVHADSGATAAATLRRRSQMSLSSSSVPSVPPRGNRLTQSRRIPYPLWLFIARSLGIKISNEKPLVATVLHLLTLGSGAGMLFTRSWYSGYDVLSLHSPTDLLDGIVAVVMLTIYTGVGLYAHRLAYRLFVHPKFLERMRLHSKTMFKVNTATVVFVVTAGFVVAQNLALRNFMYGYREKRTEEEQMMLSSTPNGTVTTEENPCQTIQICQSYYVFQLIFSVFFLVWNVIVAVVLISVARTHTLEIRGFLREVSQDAHLQDKAFRKQFCVPGSNEAKDSLKEYIWIDNDRIASVIQKVTKKRRPMIPPEVEQPPSPPPQISIENPNLSQLEDDFPPTVVLPENVQLQLNEDFPRSSWRGGRGGGGGGRFRRVSEFMDEELEEMTVTVPHVMSEQEIMHKYWKLVSSVRLTSRAFQRWVCSLTVTIVLWATIRVVYWLSHKPTLYGVLSFILPLVLLPLIASAYAEVNYEGMKVLSTILPTPRRVTMFLYLQRVPIQMTAYGHLISYGTMGTVFAAITAAFASKILLQELNPVIGNGEP